MSFNITLFGPKHHWWNDFKKKNRYGYQPRRAWFNKPNEHSSGGVGFCIPGLHVAFYWGRK